ncbi:unnamed protein product [Durusdinium trenchii]|uniref:Uncharacterized protein n=1 Tax=Durusdinium trenchii TaxID=1381693 RepID=A0ABP0QA81_9DINO
MWWDADSSWASARWHQLVALQHCAVGTCAPLPVAPALPAVKGEAAFAPPTSAVPSTPATHSAEHGAAEHGAARRVTTRLPQAKAKAKTSGLLVRISSHVQSFDDHLDAEGLHLRDLVLEGLRSEACGRTGRRGIQVSDSEDESQGAVRPRRPEASPSPEESKEDDAGTAHSDTVLHLRNFLESGGWNCCLLERHSAGRPVLRRERMPFARHAAWQRLRSASMQEGVTARGWVCAHHEKHGAIVRLMAVEVPQVEDGAEEKPGLASTSKAESPLPLLPPVDGEGLLGLLCQEDGRDAAPQLGTPLRVRFLSDTPMQRRLLREVGASCRVSMDSELAPGLSSECRPLGALGPGRSEEWPEGGISEILRSDPCQSAAAAVVRSSKGPLAIQQARSLGIHGLHGSLVAGSAHEAGQAARLSKLQSRTWADQRVREGLAKARAGDQKAAMERYDAALELCPQHKEGLVGRGAALANLGKAREALKDFDAALRIDPEDANALKYRDIARKRAREAEIASAKRPRAG